jgi:hypothetical protein
MLIDSPPPAVIQFPIYGPSRKERRLRYRSTAVPGRYFDISHVVRPATPTVVNSSPESRATNVADTVSGWHKELDAQLASLEIEGENPVPEVTENVNGRVALEARVVDEKAEDLMMPDRYVPSRIQWHDTDCPDRSTLSSPALDSTRLSTSRTCHPSSRPTSAR